MIVIGGSELPEMLGVTIWHWTREISIKRDRRNGEALHLPLGYVLWYSLLDDDVEI